jgi:predicted nucleic acid-binding protein
LAGVIALDASVLIAHLNPNNPHHRAATAILVTGIPGHMLVHTLTLAEVLVGGVRISQAASMRADLHSAGIRVAPSDDDQPLRLAELRTATELKLPDCCVLDVAIQFQATLATIDAALAKVARRRGIPVEPLN